MRWLTSTALAGAVLFGGSDPVMASSGSAGCGKDASNGDQTVTVRSNGRSRPFLLHVPRGYTGRSPRPLLLDLHGTLANGEAQLKVSGMREFADRDGFLVAAPDGGAIAGGGRSWVVPGTKPRGEAPAGGFPDDVQHLRDVVRAVQARTCQDRSKVFVTGNSAGGRMASAMACDAADVVTGVIANVGLRAGAPRTDAGGEPEPDPRTCAPARPLPVIALHGTGDRINPYDGGGSPDWQYSVPQAVERWADLLGCRSAARVTAFSSAIDKLTHSGCSRYSTMTLFRVDGGGHQWFGGDPSANPGYSALGLDPRQIETSEVVSEAIKRYAMRAPKVKPIRATCGDGRVRVRVRVATDSPLERLVVRVGRKQRTTRKASLKRTFRTKRKTVRVRARAIDRAGQSTPRTRTLRSC